MMKSKSFKLMVVYKKAKRKIIIKNWKQYKNNKFKKLN